MGLSEAIAKCGEVLARGFGEALGDWAMAVMRYNGPRSEGRDTYATDIFFIYPLQSGLGGNSGNDCVYPIYGACAAEPGVAG
jgi:hypothetical protein